MATGEECEFGDSKDLYYLGTPASGYANRLTDSTSPAQSGGQVRRRVLF